MRPHRPLRLAALLPIAALAALAACTDAVSDSDEDDELAGPAAPSAELDGKQDSATSSELRVRVGELTLWFDVRARADREGPTGQRIVIEGRASRNLVSVLSWVPDDAFGEAEIVSARKFRITLDDGHELATMLSGAPLYLSVTTATGTPREYYARIALEPRFTRFSGSRDVWLRDAVLPVWVRDGRADLTYRALVTAAGTPTSLSVSAADALVRPADGDLDPAAGGDASSREGARFEVDFGHDALVRALTGGQPLRVSAQLAATATGGARVVTKEATLVPAVVKVAMSTDDPYNGLILERVCADATRACVAAAGGRDDLGACGVYRDVQMCAAQGPVCGEDSPDLELFPIAAPELDANLALFDAACRDAGAICALDHLTFFRLPVCLDGTPELAGLVAMLSNMDDYPLEGWTGATTTRAELLASGLFAGAADAGAQLLGTLDGWAGSASPDGAEHWYGSIEVPCHNCHAWQALVVVYYPSAGRLFVVGGSYGWDS